MRILAYVLIVLSTFTFLAQAETDGARKHPNSDTNQQQEVAPNPLPVIDSPKPRPENKLYPAADSCDSRKGSDGEQEGRDSGPSGWWIIVVTGILAGITWWQAHLTRVAIKSQATTSHAQLLHSREAAKMQLFLTDDTRKRELRAYLSIKVVKNPERNTFGFVNSPNQYTPDDCGHISGVSFTIKNTGKTPAHKVTPCFFGEVKSPDTIAFPFDQEGASGGSFVIHPDMTIDVIVPTINLRKGDFAAIQSGSGSFYLWGKVEYRDVFGKECWTEFRFVFSAVQFSGSIYALAGYLHFAEGNRTEETEKSANPNEATH